MFGRMFADIISSRRARLILGASLIVIGGCTKAVPEVRLLGSNDAGTPVGSTRPGVTSVNGALATPIVTPVHNYHATLTAGGEQLQQSVGPSAGRGYRIRALAVRQADR